MRIRIPFDADPNPDFYLMRIRIDAEPDAVPQNWSLVVSMVCYKHFSDSADYCHLCSKNTTNI